MFKVLIAADSINEPSQEECFIAGYESNGDVWNGLLERNTDTFLNSLSYALYNGFNMWIRPTSGAQTQANYFRVYYDNGLSLIMPAGSNDYHNNAYSRNLENNLIVCGAGILENQTGYKCHFFDEDIIYTAKNILSMTQCGQAYNVSKIQRRSSTILSFQLSGITDVSTIGIVGSVTQGFGVPVYFTGLAGSDISPLPNGLTLADVKYITYSAAGTATFFISHTTTAGTINTGFGPSDFQNISAGQMVFGSPDTSQVFVLADGYNAWNENAGVYLKNVSGFTSNPNGVKVITQNIGYDGFGNKFLFSHATGGGSFSIAAGPTGQVQTSSNSMPRIAGMVANLMVNLGCSSYEALQRLIATASSGGTFQTYNGYGKPNLSAALNYTGVIPAEAELTMGAVGTMSLTKNEASETLLLSWTGITNAIKYNIYLDDEIYTTVANELNPVFTIPIERKYKNETKWKFQYSGVRGDIETALSAAKYIKYFKWDEFAYNN